jgi:hypothetical protein
MPWLCTSGNYGAVWRHGDLKDIAYFFNYPVFINVVNKGNLK